MVAANLSGLQQLQLIKEPTVEEIEQAINMFKIRNAPEDDAIALKLLKKERKILIIKSQHTK